MGPSNTKPAAKPVAEAAKPHTEGARASAAKPAIDAARQSPSAPPRASPTPAKPAPRPAEEKDRPPVAASLTAEKNGGVTLKLEYAGGLAQLDQVWVRMGERRAGRDWLNTRDVKLEKSGSLASIKVSLAPGEPIEGANFAFHAKKGEEELWDNAGRAFGCYVLDARTGTITAQ